MSVGFATEFMTYTRSVLANNVDPLVHTVAAFIAPFVFASATITILWWGLRMLRGQAHEPVSETATKFTTIVVYMVMSTNLWLWDDVIADFIFNFSGHLTAAITGTANPLGIADQVLFDVNLIAESLAAKAGVLTAAGWMYAISAWVEWIIGCIPAWLILAMHQTSDLMVHTIAILGPITFWLLMHESTKRYCESWVTQIVTYAIMPLILAIVATILVKFQADYAAKAVANGSVTISDVGFMVGIVFVVCVGMWMSASTAAGLAGGMALAGMGALSAIGSKVFSTAKTTAYNSARGFADGARGLSRGQYAPITRNVANSLGQLARGGAVRNGGTLQPRYARIPRSP